MDMPIMATAAPVADVLRDRRGTIVGQVEHQRLAGKLMLRDHRGVQLGIYDPRTDETRDQSGRVIGRSNLLGTLFMMEGQ